MTDITIPREAEEEVAFELWAQDYAHIDPEYRRQIWDRSYDHWWQFLPDADVVIATDDPELSNVQLGRETYINRAHAACLAMLKAWPGAFPHTFRGPLEGYGYVLLLPTEKLE